MIPSAIEPGTLYTQTDLAPILRKSLAWFERGRWAGTGPAFVKVGRQPLYRGSDVLAWLEANTRTSTSDREAA
ncbi:MAG: DNA-binding protein [Gammaproteobacteria bacterium]|nr:DNA-binding protein [Gammaproteobacteria bacterium]